MSVDQIEEQIRRLTPTDLGRLTKWFGRFLADRVTSPNSDWQESAEQIAELERRLAEFTEEVQRVIGVIANQPLRYSVRFGAWRRANLRRFPYAIFYQVCEDVPVV